MLRRVLFSLLAMLLFIPGYEASWLPTNDDKFTLVVIDAGHGGKDPGNLGTGRYRSREKDVALQVSLKLGAYIEQNLKDVKVVYTRKDDRFVELHERAAIANRQKADLFISIHCDAFTNPQAFGASTYVMGRGQGDKQMRVAMQENAVITLEDNFEEQYEGFDPSRPETYIALSLYQNAFLEQSVAFAQKVQDQFRERAKRKDRGVKQQPLVVTSRTTMPAVLIELGFLTNRFEEDFLQSDNGQNLMASAIYRAVRDYKEKREAFEKINRSELSPPIIATEEAKQTPTTQQKKDIPESESAKEAPSFYYTVQLLVSGKERKTTAEEFNGLNGVFMESQGRLFKYF
ncbi:MAG: N-acetylmuramoyl-L-alanine amidase, partial [Cryomorphaceae bacterium]|nr:N-acetylmuramoyl-L-alanine amidase [Cryomorphaceae bacterium]